MAQEQISALNQELIHDYMEWVLDANKYYHETINGVVNMAFEFDHYIAPELVSEASGMARHSGTILWIDRNDQNGAKFTVPLQKREDAA